MLVTIVTPSYNQADYLEHTIRSVLGQRGAEVEYILVDGSSADGSLAVIERYSADLAWWVSEADSGQAEAINKGFERARGEIVAWLNSDDLYAPGAISAAVQALQQEPQLGLVYGDAISIDQAGRPFNRQSFGQYSLADLAAFQIICQPAVFMRREALHQVGGLDASYHFLLDHQLWLRIAAAFPIRHVPQVWAYPRYHQAAKNLTGGPAFGQEAARIAAWLAADPGMAAQLTGQGRLIRAGAEAFKARYLLDSGRPGPAVRAYLASLAAHPGTARREWRRMLYAGLSLVGLRRLAEVYYRLRPRPPSRTSSVHDLFPG